MVFSCHSHEFLAAPKIWASFFASYIAISASLSEKSCSSSSSLLLSAYPSLLLNPQLHLPHFSCAIGVTLKISWSFLHHLPHWQCDGLEKWCHWWNGCQRRAILEACKVAMYFRRTASRFGQHCSTFFQREGSILFLFFSVDSDSTYWDLSKNDFFEISSIFLSLRQHFGLFFWQILTFGKLVCTIQNVYSIPAYSDGFRTFKKSLPVSINQSTNLLTLVVRNCSQSPCCPSICYVFLNPRVQRASVVACSGGSYVILFSSACCSTYPSVWSSTIPPIDAIL